MKKQLAYLALAATLLVSCASPEAKQAKEQKREAERRAEEQRKFDEKHRREQEEQERWRRVYSSYTDEELEYKFNSMEIGIKRGTDGMNILLAQGNGIGAMIAQGQIKSAIRERDAIGLELARRSRGKMAPPDSRPGGDLKATGSGFFITDDGFLLTNFHVVEGANSVKVKRAGQLYEAELVRKDRRADLAVLRVKGNLKFKAMPLVDSRSVKLGQRVFTLGFPRTKIQGEEPKFTEGSISGLYGVQDDSGSFQISVPVQPGNSGGALVNGAAEVVGIIVSKLQGGENVNYAIKSSRALLLLDDVPNLKLSAVEGSAAYSPEEIAQRLQESTVLLLIY